MSVVTKKEGASPKRTPTSVWLPEATLARLQRVADETGQSRNEAIVQLLNYALDAHYNGKRATRR